MDLLVVFCGMGKDSVLLSVNVTPFARDLLKQVAARCLYNEGGTLPMGQVVTAMVEYFEDENDWDDIEERVRTIIMGKVERRKERDRERKRKTGAEIKNAA